MDSMALVITLIILLWPTRWRWFVVAVGCLGVFVIGIARVYIGVHYPSDVIGGWTAALAWVIGIQLLRQRWPGKSATQAPP
jgi:undecaprenyl-diphosphatase